MTGLNVRTRKAIKNQAWLGVDNRSLGGAMRTGVSVLGGLGLSCLLPSGNEGGRHSSTLGQGCCGSNKPNSHHFCGFSRVVPTVLTCEFGAMNS